MYGEELDEDDLDDVIDELKIGYIHPVEIYRGSMIFYESSYGYIYVPDLDEDFRAMPQDMTDTEFV